VRVLLWILAGTVAAAVAGLLLGPRLIDGELVRDQLVARLARVTGESVRVVGPTDLSLWPQPRLSIGQLVVGEAARSGTYVSVERVELVLGVGGLVGLDWGPREIRLVRPQLHAAMLPTLADLGRLAERMRGELLPVDAVSVVGGRVLVRDPGLATPLELAELDLELAREAGGGPLVLTGGGRWRDQPLALEVELRPASAGPQAVRARLVLGSGPQASRFAYRGTLDLVSTRLRLDGELELAADTGRLAPLLADFGAARLAERLPPIGAFAARGRLRSDGSRLEADGLRLATAAGELQLRLTLGLAGSRDLRLDVEATRLDLPLGFDPRAAFADLWKGPPAGLVGSVAVRIGTLARGGQELLLVRLEARLPGDGTLVLETFAAQLPGTGDLELVGRLAPGPAGTSFRGRLLARVEEARPALSWAGLDPPWFLDRLGGLAIGGELQATAEGASLSRAEIGLGGARASGTFAFLVGPPPRWRLVGNVDRLVLDPWLEETVGAAARAWLAEGPPREFEIEVDLAVERLAWRGLRAERVHLRAELADGQLRIDELASPQLGGGSARLSGTLGPGGASDLLLEVEADQPARLARALELDPTLPALLEAPLEIRARLHEGGAGRRLDAELVTSEAALRAEFDLPRGTLEPDRWQLTGEFANTAALAARLSGRAGLAAGLTGRLRAEFDARREASGWRIAGRIGAGRLDLTAGLELVEGHGLPLLRGRLALERADAPSLADLYRLAEVPLGLPAGPIRAWPGAWPRRPFGTPRLPSVDLDLALEFGLEREDGTTLGRGNALLAFAGRALALDAIDLPLAGGRLTGRLLAELGPQSGRIEGALALTTGSLADLAETLGIAGAPRGIVDLELAFASEGRSIAELVGNVGGRGALTLRELGPADAVIPGADRLLAVRSPLVLERGVARGEDLAVEVEGGPGRGRLAFDLASWILDLDLAFPGGRLRLLGPPERLRRYVEAAAPSP